MSTSKSICLIVVLFLSFGCNPNSTTDSVKDKETETTATVDTELMIESRDTAIASLEKPIIDSETEENTPLSAPSESAQTVYEDTDAPVEEYPSGTMFVNNSYLILQSTTSYSAAMNTAKQASKKMGLPIDYRGYVFDFKQGLKSTTACGCGEVHEYVPRGRGDNGNYLSIEHTSSFTEFTDGYYIVVAASGQRQKLKALLPKAKEFLADAYIKDAEVYIGCMH